MLALSATDIHTLRSPWEKDFHVKALEYRVKSIESLNKAVSAGIESFEKGNAILATCYSLMFQSVMLKEALADYFSFIRGCVSVAMQMGMRQMKFLFIQAFGDDQLDLIRDTIEAAPLLPPDVVARANRSLEKMGPLCQTKVELQMYGLLLNIARTLITSSGDGELFYWSQTNLIANRHALGYIELRKIYAFFSFEMQHEEFREFTNPANEVCQLLQAHFVAMQLIMTPITKTEWRNRESADREADEGGDGTTGNWLQTLHATIPVHLLDYYEWTKWIDGEVQKGRIYNGVYD